MKLRIRQHFARQDLLENISIKVQKTAAKNGKAQFNRWVTSGKIYALRGLFNQKIIIHNEYYCTFLINKVKNNIKIQKSIPR